MANVIGCSYKSNSIAAARLRASDAAEERRQDRRDALRKEIDALMYAGERCGDRDAEVILEQVYQLEAKLRRI